MADSFFYKRLGKRISTERKKKQLSQECLALETDIDRSYLAKMELGRANPTIKLLNKITRRLDISLSHLLKEV